MLRGCSWGRNARPLPRLAGSLPAAPLGGVPGVTYSEGLSLKPTHPGRAWCPRVARAQNSALLSPLQQSLLAFRSPHEHKLFKDARLTVPSLTPGLRLWLQPSRAFPGCPSRAHPGDTKVDRLPLIREPRAQVSSVAGGREASGGWQEHQAGPEGVRPVRTAWAETRRAGRGACGRPGSRGPGAGHALSDCHLGSTLLTGRRQEGPHAASTARASAPLAAGVDHGHRGAEAGRVTADPGGRHKRGSLDCSTRGQTPLRPAGWLEAVVLLQSGCSGLVDCASTGLQGL